ncbi:tetratricopeptide repeat protein [Neorhizobium lilium]|nr:tetratricopeptide repeat protein [Neorhizobium lilium]
MKRIVAFLLFVLGSAVARADPPQITWEWFNAAETYRNYKVKGKDDLRLAAHYYRLAAERGNAAAAYKLGDCYENGTGVAKDAVTALEWYRRSAAGGDRYAALRIGWFYQKGIAVTANPADAVEWYRLAAQRKNIWAYHMLAFLYFDGEGVPQDRVKAREYFEISLPQTDDGWAKVKLAELIRSSDPTRARRLLQEAVRQGNPQAPQDLKLLEIEQK